MIRVQTSHMAGVLERVSVQLVGDYCQMDPTRVMQDPHVKWALW